MNLFRKQPDAMELLLQVPIQGSTADRIAWAQQVLTFLLDYKFYSLWQQTKQEIRLRKLLIAFDLLTAPQKRNVSWVIRDLILGSPWSRDFCQIGLADESGFVHEVTNRIFQNIISKAANEEDFAHALWNYFQNQKDYEWIITISPEVLKNLADVASACFTDRDRVHLRQEIVEALNVLTISVSNMGLSPAIRARLPHMRILESPFLKFTKGMGDPARVPADVLENHIQACLESVDTVRKNLEETGVSVNIVYRLDMIVTSLARIRLLHELLNSEKPYLVLPKLMFSVFEEKASHRKLRDFLSDNLYLLSRKIVETTSQSGEHYITKTRKEYFHIMGSAAGGGLLTAGTATFKLLVGSRHIPLFFDGFFTWINYSGTFLLMQAFHFTLATKQPSMTASALAAKLEGQQKDSPTDEFVDVVQQITRTQVSTVLGNIGIVVPSCFLVHYAWIFLFHTPLIDSDYALYMVKSLHPFKSLTIPFAALTGAILWSASMVSGWFENEVVLRQIPQAIERSRIFNRWFGREESRRIGKWFLSNAAGIGNNVSLGFFLAFTPVIGKFFGFPLDVRHVTLSTGALTLAALSVAPEDFSTHAVAWGAFGIVIIGVFNVSVSFFLALIVAARARKIDIPVLLKLLSDVGKSFVKKPIRFFFPPREPKSSSKIASHP